ncbi:MAG TPA: MASE3 domain-containing protein, partial [Armatimonadota bacterium]|nr:MASE3 domain-containing protein [Armatimonadota bacterium]
MRVSLFTWRNVSIALGIAVLTLLMGALSIRRETYLLFHSLIELAGIIVGVAIFSVGWSTRRVAGNNFLLVFAIGSFFTGLIGLLHALAFKGMRIFPWDNANLPTQFAVAACYLESLTYLGGAIALSRRRPIVGERLIAIYLGITVLLIASIVPFDIFPTAFHASNGLTSFDIASRYVAAAILLLAGVLLWRRRTDLDDRITRLLLIAIGLKVISEIAFTLYGMDVYGAYNAVGHLCKGYATLILYLALVKATVTNPYETLFHQFQQTKEHEDQLRSFIEDAPAALAMFDRQMRYMSASKRWLRDYHLEGRNVIGLSHYDVFPEIPERWRTDHARGLAGESLHADEDRFVRFDGNIQWLRWEIRPWKDIRGDIGGITIFSEDITEKKNAEDALREREVMLSTIGDNLPEGALYRYRYDADGNKHFEFISAGIERITGVPPAEILRDVSTLHATIIPD